MKKHLVVAAAMAIVVGMAGGAWAAGSATLTGSATVADVCVLSGTADIDFGAALDADTNSGGVANIALTNNLLSLWCTNGASVAITVGNGANWDAGNTTRRLNDGGTGYIAYALNGTTAMTGGGPGSNLISAWDLKGSIPAGALDLAPAGSYTDTVTVTVTP